jgi:tRNA pseudouridine38-40 synthase
VVVGRRRASRGAAARAAAAPRTFRGVVEYDGTDFSGWQVQPGRRTVEGVLEAALADLLGAAVPVLAAGRTDAGVHAAGQGISFRAATALAPERLAAAVNARLPGDVRVLDLAAAAPDFHATHGARGKVYRYTLLCRREPSPLHRRTAWHVRAPLDPARLRRAAAALVGTHDFAAFRTNPGPAAAGGSTVRTLRSVRVRRAGDLVLLDFEGDGFLHHQVRNMAGTLVRAATGAWPVARVAAALASRDRRLAGPCAPAHALCLVSVAYGGARRRRHGGPGAAR